MPSHFEDDAPDFSLRDVLDILRRRKWVIIQAFIAISVFGAVTAALAQPIYGARAKLLVETPGHMNIQGTASADSPLFGLLKMRLASSVQTQLEIMRSGEFRARVAKKVPNAANVPALVLDPEVKEGTEIIAIRAEATDPKAAANWANVAAEEYAALTSEANKAAITTTKGFLMREARKAELQLAIAEAKLKSFQKQNDVGESDAQRNTQLANAIQIQNEARRLQNEMISMDARISGLKKRLLKEPEQYKEIKIKPNVEVDAQRTEIARLKAERARSLGTYQEDSKTITDLDANIASLEEAMAKLSTTIQEEVDVINPRRAVMEEQLRELELSREANRQVADEFEGLAIVTEKKAKQAAPRFVELNRIQRERELAEESYRNYTAQLRDVAVREQTIVASAYIMEKAWPSNTPIRPDKAQTVVLSAMIGLLVGVGFAFLQEFMDDRVNTTDDIERVVGLPTLGVVPTMRDGTDCLLIGQDALSPVTESYRAMRNAVQYSSLDHPLHTLMVTSCHPGEGKSVTSANLGIAMALQGKRVLLVDCDLRRPSIHQKFRLSAEPGLTSVLAREVSLDEAMHTTAIDGFRVLTAGPLPPNPAELLNSQVMIDFLDDVKQQFDLIIIDTPPTIPVTDSQVLATRVDGVVLVVEAGQSRKTAVKHARDLLEQTRGRLLGVVLNKIDQSGKGHYYHYYYRGGYGQQKPTRGVGPGAGYGPSGGAYGGSGGRLGIHDDLPPTNGRPQSIPEQLGADERTIAGLPDRLRDWE